MAASDQTPKPLSWWQTFLTTPALLLALGGGIGTAVPAVWKEIKAYRMGVESSRLAEAQEQQTLWEKNLACVRGKSVYTITIAEARETGVTLCPSGDALLKYQRSATLTTYTWVPYPYGQTAPAPPPGDAPHEEAPSTRIVYGAVQCGTMQAHIVVLIFRDAARPERCQAEYITARQGKVLRQTAVSCAMCDNYEDLF